MDTYFIVIFIVNSK